MRVPTSFHPCLSASLIAIVCLAAAGCSQEPQVDTNTPEYLFSEVHKAVADGRFEKALESSGALQTKFPKSEQAAKARLLSIVLLLGQSDGYRSIADAYLAGMEADPDQYGTLRSTAFNYHRKRKSVALVLYQACDRFLKRHTPESTYALESSWPVDDSEQGPDQLEEVRGGNLLDSEQQEEVEVVELPKGVARTLARFVGAEEDLAQARTTLGQGAVDLVPSGVLLTMAQCILDNQKLFGREGLSEVKNYSIFLHQADKTLNMALASLEEHPDEAIQAGADELKAEIDKLYGR
ncbi:MAG: hypothetical protein F4X19_06475 [Acidobacteria bacterium]|nr:hypothetical protein [Acidobacteriota bacterium]